MFKIETTPENAAKFKDWIANRGGVAYWKSANLGNAGASWSTPATIAIKDLEDSPRKAELLKEFSDENTVVGYPKINWQMEDTPTFVVKDPKEIGVAFYKTVQKFRIGLRMTGLSLKLTDASSRKVHAALAKFENSTYIFGGDDGRECHIQVPERVVPLDEYVTE